MSRRAILESLRQRTPLIAPSLLRCDFGNLHREVELLERGGAEVLHLDVMDGRFVPNLTYGPVVIEGLRRLTELPFDAHLMIAEPGRLLKDFVAAGCQAITIHVEAVPEPVALLRRIRDSGCAAGLALNPKTPVSRIAPVIEECDIVLVMSVEPGFGGQAFQPECLEKVTEVRRLGGDRLLVSIDGGIDRNTVSAAAAAGADMFVAGTAIFQEPDYGAAIASLREEAMLAGCAHPR